MSSLLSPTRAFDNEFGYGYIGPSAIEWRAKEHAKSMASKDFSAAEEWLDDIGRELKIARHWLAVAKSLTAQGGAK